MNNQYEDKNIGKQVYTTGEAAKICNVSQQTIIRCFDSGRLHGFKVPGSRFRRIPHAELIRFMHSNNMDMTRMITGPLQVLVVGLGEVAVDSIIKAHATGHNINIHHADDAWAAGYLAHQHNPSLILVNSNLPGLSKNTMMSSVAVETNRQEPMIVIVDDSSQNALDVAHSNVDSTEVDGNIMSASA